MRTRKKRRTPGIGRKPSTPTVNIVAAFIYSPSRGLAPAIAALGATKFRAPGLRPTGPEIELSFFETTPSRRDSGGNIQNLMLYATPKLSPFLSKQNPQYSGRNRLLAGTVFLAGGNNICDEAEIGCAQLSTSFVEPQVQYSHFPHSGQMTFFLKVRRCTFAIPHLKIKSRPIDPLR